MDSSIPIFFFLVFNHVRIRRFASPYARGIVEIAQFSSWNGILWRCCAGFS